MTMGMGNSMAEFVGQMRMRRADRRRARSLRELDGMSSDLLNDIGLRRDASGHYRPY
jgi:uncharacterized protein YjiS (DUF1127 family)